MIHVYNFSGTNVDCGSWVLPDGRDAVVPSLSLGGSSWVDGIGCNVTVIVDGGGVHELAGPTELEFFSAGVAFGLVAVGLMVAIRLVRRGVTAEARFSD